MRAAKQFIILGFNGTGKTTLVEKFVKASLVKQEKVLVVTPDGTEWTHLRETMLKTAADFDFSGAKRYVWDEDPDVIGRIYKYFFEGLLIFDDCRSYLSSLIDPNLKRIFMRRRQMKVDVVLCGHGFSDVPVQAFTNTSDYFLFLTLDKFKRKKDIIPRYELILEAQQRINARALDSENAWVKQGDPSMNIHYYEHIEPLKI
jgi:hypothetical protein